MTKPLNDINQQELRSAIEWLMEGAGDADSQQQVYYRNPLKVAREEWRKQPNKNVTKGFTPAVLANMPTMQLLNTPSPATPAETVDMEAFKEACMHCRSKASRVKPSK